MIGEEPKFWLERVYDVDSLYLAVSNRANSTRIEPPSVEWDHCSRRNSTTRVASSLEIFMLYGRMLHCHFAKHPGNQPPELGFSGFCNNGLEQIQHTDDQIKAPYLTNRTFVNCILKKCPEGQFPHYDDLNQSAPYQLAEGIHCKSKFVLDEKMVGFANDNGCQQRYNKDPYGICHHCAFLTSDCLLFDPYCYQGDYYTVDLGNYDQAQWAQQIYYKDDRVRRING